jgi:hypothetical protein
MVSGSYKGYTSARMTISIFTLKHLVDPFFAEDPALPLYAAACCGRIFVGRDKPTACRTCPKSLQVFTVEANNLQDLHDSLVRATTLDNSASRW